MLALPGPSRPLPGPLHLLVRVHCTATAIKAMPLPRSPARTQKHHLKQMVIRVGTECSGMEPLPWVFSRLGLLGAFQFVFSCCDKNKSCRRLIMQGARHWMPASAQGWTKHVMLTDITTRNAKELPDHDLYVAGFPMRLRKGAMDAQGRGHIITHIVEALTAKLPRAFILETVRSLVTCHSDTFSTILGNLRTIAGGIYAVSWRILNTADHGIPQSRHRVYIVGIQKSLLRPDAISRMAGIWPPPRPPEQLADFLDNDTKGAKRREMAFRAETTAGAIKKLGQLLKKVRATSGNPRSRCDPYVFDIEGSNPQANKGRCPCINRSRGSKGFYLPSRGRRMTLRERLRLQGLPETYLLHREDISDRQLGLMIGDAMSGNILERLLARILPACGLAPEGLKDPWLEQASS